MSSEQWVGGPPGTGVLAERVLLVDGDGRPVSPGSNGSGATTGQLAVVGRAYRSVSSFSRPSNTTAYAALDVIGNADSAVLTFSDIGPAGGHVQLSTATLNIARTSVPSGMGQLLLHLYASSPPNIADNAAFSASAGSRSAYLRSISLSPAVVGGGFLAAAPADYLGAHVKLADGSANLFGVLQTIGGFTPASATEYEVALHAVELGL